MPFAPAVVERTMKVQEVLMQAISGQRTWLEAEEILGWAPRTLRRWRWRYRQRGYDGLWDRRRQQPSPRCAPVAEVARIARLYRERYAGFNAAHYVEPRIMLSRPEARPWRRAWCTRGPLTSST
jgi:hypothetical protein